MQKSLTLALRLLDDFKEINHIEMNTESAQIVTSTLQKQTTQWHAAH